VIDLMRLLVFVPAVRGTRTPQKQALNREQILEHTLRWPVIRPDARLLNVNAVLVCRHDIRSRLSKERMTTADTHLPAQTGLRLSRASQQS
jgi:hypothetical protein